MAWSWQALRPHSSWVSPPSPWSTYLLSPKTVLLHFIAQMSPIRKTFLGQLIYNTPSPVTLYPLLSYFLSWQLHHVWCLIVHWQSSPYFTRELCENWHLIWVVSCPWNLNLHSTWGRPSINTGWMNTTLCQALRPALFSFISHSLQISCTYKLSAAPRSSEPGSFCTKLFLTLDSTCTDLVSAVCQVLGISSYELWVSGIF
jgi:hypothetical protein